VILVDSQCHASPVWYEPVETLLDQMDRNDVSQAVLIQLLGQFDNGYLEDCRRRYSARFSIVVSVDAARADAADELVRLAGRGAAGVRLRPATRSPGDDPLAIWRAAKAADLAVSCVGVAETFAAPEFFDLVAQLPDLPIVLEHLGGASRVLATDTSDVLRTQVFELARFPNVYLKLPGLGELVPRNAVLPAEGIPFDPQSEVLRLALGRFGPERLMWGSDFPVVAAREGYRNALHWVREALADLPGEAQACIFGGTARRVFRLPDA
jgi:L-fuconolactonase